MAKQIAVKLCHSDCLHGQRTKNAGDVCCRCPPSRCHLFIKAFHQHMCGSVSQSLRRCRLFLWSFFSATVLFSRKKNKWGGTKQNQASDQPLFNKRVMTKIPQVNCSRVLMGFFQQIRGPFHYLKTPWQMQCTERYTIPKRVPCSPQGRFLTTSSRSPNQFPQQSLHC